MREIFNFTNIFQFFFIISYIFFFFEILIYIGKYRSVRGTMIFHFYFVSFCFNNKRWTYQSNTYRYVSSVTYFVPFHRFILRDHNIVYTMLHVSHIYSTLCLLLFIIFYFLSCYIIEWTNRKSVRRVCVSAFWHASFLTDFFGPHLPPIPSSYHIPATRITSKIWYVSTFNLFRNAIRRSSVCCDNICTCACRTEIYVKSLSERNKTWNNFIHTHIQWLYFGVCVL